MWKPTHAQITVHGARNLKVKGKSGTNDAYAVVELGRESHRTTVVERTTDPVWNEDYVFSLPSDLKTSDGVIRVGVYHRNLLSMDELLGQTVIPLYKIHINDRPQIRRFHLTSGMHSGTGSRRGSSSLDDAEDVVSRGDVDLTIVFTVQPITQSQIDLLRSSKVKSHASQIDEQIVRPRYARRASLPAPAPKTEASAKTTKSRRSVMSMLDVPSSFSAFRRRLSSIGGATLPRVVEAPATWLAHEELPTSEGEISHQEDTTAAVSIKRDKRGVETSRSRPRSMPDLLDDPQPITISDLSDEETEEHVQAKDHECDVVNDDVISEVVTSEEETRRHLPAKDRECDLIDDDVINEVLTSEEVTKKHLPAKDRECHLVNDDVISDVFTKKVAEYQDDNAAVTIGNRTKHSSATEQSSTESVNRFERMVHRSPTDNDLDRFSGYSREDLIAMVIRQHAQISVTDTYVAELEHYTSILVLRAMEIQPHLLQTTSVTDLCSTDIAKRGIVNSTVSKPASVAKRATKEIMSFVQNR